jgi:hypothetical protein
MVVSDAYERAQHIQTMILHQPFDLEECMTMIREEYRRGNIFLWNVGNMLFKHHGVPFHSLIIAGMSAFDMDTLCPEEIRKMSMDDVHLSFLFGGLNVRGNLMHYLSPSVLAECVEAYPRLCEKEEAYAEQTWDEWVRTSLMKDREENPLNARHIKDACYLGDIALLHSLCDGHEIHLWPRDTIEECVVEAIRNQNIPVLYALWDIFKIVPNEKMARRAASYDCPESLRAILSHPEYSGGYSIMQHICRATAGCMAILMLHGDSSSYRPKVKDNDIQSIMRLLEKPTPERIQWVSHVLDFTDFGIEYTRYRLQAVRAAQRFHRLFHILLDSV